MGVTVLIAGGGTGGHLMPALALAKGLCDARPALAPVLVGAQRGIEAQVLPRYPYRFHLLPLEPIYRHQWWKNLRWPLVLWRAWRAVTRVLDAERPALVIGTGGYAAGPVLWMAGRRGIPLVLQEPDASPGITTRLLAKRARQVHLGFPEAQARLRVGPDTQVFAFGNPIHPPEPGDRSGALHELELDAGRPTVLIFGGSQGARAINEATAAALAQGLLGDVNVVWGTGAAHAERYAPLARRGQVVVRGFLDPMTPAYRAADLVVCRAGAMTLAEICAWGLPSILIPLPTAAADHQTHNARALAAAGAAIHLPESELTPAAFGARIASLAGDWERLAAISAAARGRGRPDATATVVSKILTLLR
jgi:UDP-N-acetylglucosamine--N-acetylmuramyl-(pentapeptide) pyrophosphoryl-undecaprenol N-acetylglucosamine transferase